MKITISKIEIKKSNKTAPLDLPKYVSGLINLANRTAQGTRPKVVGNMSEMFQEFESTAASVTPETWKEWYVARNPDAIWSATKKISRQIENLKSAIKQIDEEMIHHWAEDLVIEKTFEGLFVQKVILEKLAAAKGLQWRLATKEEEAKGIDGYVGDTAYSIKPTSYKIGKERSISDTIHVKMIYYTKTDAGVAVEIEE